MIHPSDITLTDMFCGCGGSSEGARQVAGVKVRYALNHWDLAIQSHNTNHHLGGWWKNPDYEQCFHLSISFRGGRNKHHLERILTGLFGHYLKWVWVEPPYSDYGKTAEVWHYRLFCDPLWEPIKPRGEVYSTKFTEIGWKSYSELHA